MINEELLFQALIMLKVIDERVVSKTENRTTMQTTRRNFIKKAGLGAAAPLVLPSHVWSAEVNPNDRITVGFIGMGLQGRGLTRGFVGHGQAKVVAVCDVDTTRREHAKRTIDESYGNTDCAAYEDFRELIGREDIDAVCIATPDHWHAVPTIAALHAGKDVYCEKPLTHNIHEAIEVMRAAEENERIVQTGSMQRSSKEFRIACELVRNGVIGKITHVHSHFGGPPVPCDLPEEEMEPGLNWDLWCGPAPFRPYNATLSPRGINKHFPLWRRYKEYGGGNVCDWGAHHLDITHWGLGMDRSGPIVVEPPENEAEQSGVELTYSNGVPVTHVNGGPHADGPRFFGTNGQVWVTRGQFQLMVEGRTVAEFVRNKTQGTSCAAQVQLAETTYLQDAKVRLYKSRNQIWDFLDCVESRKQPVASAETGARTAIACHLINQAYFHREEIKWNPAKLRFAEGTGEAAWLTRDYRIPWSM